MIAVDFVGSEDTRESVSFVRDEPISCPICDEDVFVEDFRFGRGRMDAGELYEDLQREYKYTEEFGEVFPFMFYVYTCPNCYFSALPRDFQSAPPYLANILSTDEAIQKREQLIRSMFSDIPDFSKRMTLTRSLVGYVLAIWCYQHFKKQGVPTYKQAVCTLRSAWLCKIMLHHKYGDYLEQLKAIFYRKAQYLYSKCIQLDSSGGESFSNESYLGPDIDKDFGYEGVVYLSAWLTFHYSFMPTDHIKETVLHKHRNNLSRIFGFGKAKKEKPSALLRIARNLYEQIDGILREIESPIHT